MNDLDFAAKSVRWHLNARAWVCEVLQNDGLYLYYFQKLSLYCTQTSFREFYWDRTFKSLLLGDVWNAIVCLILILPAVHLCIVIALIYLVTVCFLQCPHACSALVMLTLNLGSVADGAVLYQKNTGIYGDVRWNAGLSTHPWLCNFVIQPWRTCAGRTGQGNGWAQAAALQEMGTSCPQQKQQVTAIFKSLYWVLNCNIMFPCSESGQI